MGGLFMDEIILETFIQEDEKDNSCTLVAIQLQTFPPILVSLGSSCKSNCKIGWLHIPKFLLMNSWEHGFMFPPPLQKAIDIICIHLISTKYQQFLINKLLCKFVDVGQHFKNVQIHIFVNYVNKGTFSLEQWIQMMMKFQEHRKQRFHISYSTMAPHLHDQ